VAQFIFVEGEVFGDGAVGDDGIAADAGDSAPGFADGGVLGNQAMGDSGVGIGGDDAPAAVTVGGIVFYGAKRDGGAAAKAAGDAAAGMGGVIFEAAAGDGGAGIETEDGAADGEPIPFDLDGRPKAIDNGNAVQDGVGIFGVLEGESTMRIRFGGLTVDDGGGDDVRVGGIGTADGDAFPLKAEVAIAVTGVDCRR